MLSIGGYVGYRSLVPSVAESTAPIEEEATALSVGSAAATPPPENNATLAVLEQAPETGETPAHFTVRCVDSDGTPVEGANVYTIYSWYDRSKPIGVAAERDYSAPCVTDGSGEAKAPVPEAFSSAGWSLNFFAHKPGISAGSKRLGVRGLSVDEIREEVYELEMMEVANITGRVILPEGYNAERVEIYLHSIFIDLRRGLHIPLFDSPSDVGPPAEYKVRVASDGSFTLRDIPHASSPRLYAHGPGLAEMRIGGHTHRIENGFEILIQREAAIEGYTLDAATSAPIPGVRVYAHPGRTGPVRLSNEIPFSTVSDSNGFYHINSLPDVT